ncbi:ribbon-helix-helix domain-containing protein [Rhizobium sp. C1]|uniref:ribbon-helix-helix domain-containing protein n=1 Tax=Rhizobium sp. C1 TaxID=1349799 RepID=UPI001E558AF3|nr:ribbon-helix-helix domain-containing protein [Rhizobium sp. C1]MCD2176603.1 ribbon-helix-helix domain-containing protein [Rhizobium sp. C1]
MIRKHSVTLRGHRTSFSLEDEFWEDAQAIARRRNLSIAALLTEIDESRDAASNLSSAIRLHVLRHFKHASEAASDAREPGRASA